MTRKLVLALALCLAWGCGAASAPLLTLPQLGVDRATSPNGPWTLYLMGLGGVQAPLFKVDPIGGVASLPSLVVGGQQAPYGQLVQATAPYPASLLASAQDIYRFDFGGFPIGDEFYAGNTAGVKGTQVLAGTLRIPAGPTPLCGAVPCQDAAIAGYAQSLNPNRFALAGFFESGLLVGGGSIGAINTVTVNCENHAVGCGPLGGLNFTYDIGLEHDAVLYSVGGAGPGGKVQGIVSLLNVPEAIAPTGTTIAFDVASQPGAGGVITPWQNGYSCETGTAVVCVNIGQASGGATANSMKLAFDSTDPSGVGHQNFFQQDSASNLNFANTAAPGGATTRFMASYPQWIDLVGGGGGNAGLKVVASDTGSQAAFLVAAGVAATGGALAGNDAAKQLQLAANAVTTNGIGLTTAAGPITLAGAGGLTITGLPTSGSSVGRLCITAGGVVFVGTGC